MFKTLLSDINQHSRTSLERRELCPYPKVKHYLDDKGRNRFVCSNDNGIVICGLLTERLTKAPTHTITAMYTTKEHRRKGYMRNLVAVAKTTLDCIEFSHYLSDDGEAFVNRGK